jgi:hypothetical protein
MINLCANLPHEWRGWPPGFGLTRDTSHNRTCSNIIECVADCCSCLTSPARSNGPRSTPSQRSIFTAESPYCAPIAREEFHFHPGLRGYIRRCFVQRVAAKAVGERSIRTHSIGNLILPPFPYFPLITEVFSPCCLGSLTLDSDVVVGIISLMPTVRTLPHQYRPVSNRFRNEMVSIEFEMLLSSHLFAIRGWLSFGIQAVEFEASACK